MKIKNVLFHTREGERRLVFKLKRYLKWHTVFLSLSSRKGKSYIVFDGKKTRYSTRCNVPSDIHNTSFWRTLKRSWSPISINFVEDKFSLAAQPVFHIDGKKIIPLDSIIYIQLVVLSARTLTQEDIADLCNAGSDLIFDGEDSYIRLANK